MKSYLLNELKEFLRELPCLFFIATFAVGYLCLLWFCALEAFVGYETHKVEVLQNKIEARKDAEKTLTEQQQ